MPSDTAEKLLNHQAKLVVLIIIIILGFLLRFQYINDEGGDHKSYKKAINTFLAGENPYEYTVKSFERVELKKGYAYLPTLLYIQSFFVKVNQVFNGDWATKHMWKIPVLLADLVIVVIITKRFYRKDFSSLCVFTVFWLFNPHILARKEYVLYDPLATLFLLLSFTTDKEKSWLQGLFFAIAVSFKTFPIILLPALLLKAKNKIHFLLSGVVFAVIISVPFFRDLQTYLNGTLLVHTERGVQGRPFLTFLSFYGYQKGINFYQTIHSSIYSTLALVLPWATGIYLYFKNKKLSAFQLSLIPIGLYYLFTPVLNRTHLLWFLPIILIGLHELLNKKKRHLYAIVVGLFVFLYGYLFIWNSGFMIYDCSMVSIEPTEKASTRTCAALDTFGFSHCPKKLGKCIPHCCTK